MARPAADARPRAAEPVTGGPFEGLAQHFESLRPQEQVQQAAAVVAHRHADELRAAYPALDRHLGVWRDGTDVVAGLPDEHPHLAALERLEFGDETQTPGAHIARLQQRMPVEYAGEIVRAVRW